MRTCLKTLTDKICELGVHHELAHLVLGRVVSIQSVASRERLTSDCGVLQCIVEQSLHLRSVDGAAKVRQFNEVVYQYAPLTGVQHRLC